MKNALNDLLLFYISIFSLLLEIIAFYVVKFHHIQMHLTWNNFIFIISFHMNDTHLKCMQKSTSISITCTPSNPISNFLLVAILMPFWFDWHIKTAYRMQCWSHKTIFRHQVEFPSEWQRIIIKIWCHKMDQRLLNMPPALLPIHRLCIQILIYHRCKCKPFSKYKYNVYNITQLSTNFKL